MRWCLPDAVINRPARAPGRLVWRLPLQLMSEHQPDQAMRQGHYPRTGTWHPHSQRTIRSLRRRLRTLQLRQKQALRHRKRRTLPHRRHQTRMHKTPLSQRCKTINRFSLQRRHYLPMTQGLPLPRLRLRQRRPKQSLRPPPIRSIGRNFSMMTSRRRPPGIFGI